MVAAPNGAKEVFAMGWHAIQFSTCDFIISINRRLLLLTSFLPSLLSTRLCVCSVYDLRGGNAVY